MNPNEGLKIHAFKNAHTEQAQADRELAKVARYMVHIASTEDFRTLRHKACAWCFLFSASFAHQVRTFKGVEARGKTTTIVMTKNPTASDLDSDQDTYTGSWGHLCYVYIPQSDVATYIAIGWHVYFYSFMFEIHD